MPANCMTGSASSRHARTDPRIKSRWPSRFCWGVHWEIVPVINLLIHTALILIAILSLAACSDQKTKTREDSYYSEPYRPQIHFTPEKGWMNDPNGLVYYKGEYHLFYQYYPDSTVWGPMHWGHAVSTDLVHWKHLPIALFPDSLGYIFSGSAVVDENNTSGFQTGDEKPMVAIFTYHNMQYEKAGRTDRESQGIAYSLDRGRTWTKYSGNPVIKNKGDLNFRDPNVFWYEPGKYWVLALAVGDHVEFYASPDLKNWELTGSFGKGQGSHGGVWECPNLFPMQTPEGEKWVLLQNMDRGAVSGGSGTQYFIGRFNGTTFINENDSSEVLWFDYGADDYAGVTWNHAPDGRSIFIGWMSNWNDYAQKVPTQTWRSAMTVPHELSLKKTDDGYRLFQLPVKELEILRNDTILMNAQIINDSTQFKITSSVQKDIELVFDVSKSTAENFGLILSNSKNEFVKIGFDAAKSEFFIDRIHSGNTGFSPLFAAKHVAPYRPGNKLSIRALVDVSSVEVFVDDGKLAMTEIFFPTEDFNQVRLYSENGNAELSGGVIYGLKPAW